MHSRLHTSNLRTESAWAILSTIRYQPFRLSFDVNKERLMHERHRKIPGCQATALCGRLWATRLYSANLAQKSVMLENDVDWPDPLINVAILVNVGACIYFVINWCRIQWCHTTRLLTAAVFSISRAHSWSVSKTSPSSTTPVRLRSISVSYVKNLGFHSSLSS